jgi:hypothetical protein
MSTEAAGSSRRSISEVEAVVVEDPAPGPVRVLVAVEPALFSELLVRLLAEPGLVEVTADAEAGGPFDVVVRNADVPVPAGAIEGVGIELRSMGPTGPDVAVVSTAAGDEVIPIATVDDLAALIGRFGRP